MVVTVSEILKAFFEILHTGIDRASSVNRERHNLLID